jgi:glycine cleavage system aminomethyltransferase T
MGYGSFIDFEHEFVGRDALQKLAKGPHRKKVTLALEDGDIIAAIGSQLGKNERAKFMEFPSAVYSMHPFDRVMAGGRMVGVSTWVGYSSNERKMLTLAVLDADHAEPGTEVTFVWGEENGGTRKPTVERHKQIEIRAVVSPVPYAEAVRKTYVDRAGWRTPVA